MNRNIYSKDYNQIYFGSDFHCFHQKDFIWKPRGFSTWQEHTDFILNGAYKLTENDLLIYLGDYALNSFVGQVEESLTKIKAKIIYIFGNHESCVSKIACDPHLPHLNHITFIKNSIHEMSIDNQRFVLCHYPIISWNGLSHGSYMIHGHVHGNLQMSSPQSTEGRILDVGVDNTIKYNGTSLFKLGDVLNIMQNKNKSNVDHH